MKNHLLHIFIFIASFFTASITSACTDFKLVAKDGTLLITRSMEFGIDVQSNIRTSPRGRVFKTTTPNNLPGYGWTAKYGYLYLDGFTLDIALDGMNEAGLTFEYLYLPNETQYQTIPAGKDNMAVPYTNFGDWVLGNFQTIDEVKHALSTIYVSSSPLPQLGNIVLPAHASIYDASGRGIVVEFYNNKINIYDNIGIMTNAPKYDWQVTNLRNYINLSPNNPNPVKAGTLSFASTGQGSGAVGLPGDASPPSRFVKTAFMLKTVYPVQTADDLLNLAEHIINNVDLPAGYIRSTDNGKTSSDITQWVVFKDVTHKTLYYRTYNSMTLRKISMNQLDFSENAAPLKLPVATTPYTMNVTDQFINTKTVAPR